MPPASQKMKLHLPSALRKALLAVSVVSMTVASTVQAAIMHPSVSLQTYTDFGSNMGRYTIYQQNELLQYLNKDGVRIIYTQGEAPYQLGQKMISYESMVDGGPFTAIGYNATATVRHNGVTNPVFTGRFIGSDQAIHYAGIEYRSCENNTFLLTPEIDYKITRLSKIITDITPSALYDARAHKLKGEDIGHMLQYRAGGGYMQQADEEGKTTWLTGAYTYVVGGIVTNSGFGYSRGYDYVNDEGKKDVRNITDDSYTVSIIGVDGWGADTAGTPTHPLPFVTQGGDSGSPVWVWNQESQAYELLSCHQARGSYDSYSRGASEWTKDTLDYFCVDVDMDAAKHEVHLQAVLKADKTTYRATANGNTTASTTPMHGSVTNAEGTAIEGLDFIGVRNGINTWANLVDLKDDPVTVTAGKEQIQHWYAYGNEYLNANNTTGNPLQYADLFMTENLVFQSSATDNNIILDADVDLGIGYAQFSKTSGSDKASFTISGHDDDISRDYNFNHAGYIVDKDVNVHLQIANQEVESKTNKDYFREWRKVGEGDLYLEGSGDNHIFLNVGGKGTTFLKEQDGGYAAYNVLINNGATVNLNGDINQVKRDVTFGYGGGVLDFAAQDKQEVTMDWYSTTPGAGPENGRFTISALTQDAVIANTSNSTTITYKEKGETKFIGSFWDGTTSDQPATGTLKVVYDGGKDSTWTLNSIHTKLSGASGLEVQTGTVKLVGTLTEHAQGSLTGFNQNRYSNEDDWHYADAQMNVKVGSGATFELGSHARLTGDVTVQNGGTFLMREGVRHEKEYIEGWYELESTYAIAEYYGLHGNVNLEAEATMRVEFSEKTDANTTLGHNISGSGSMTVDTGKGTLTLAGDNSGFSGSKQLENGALILHNMDAAGNVNANKWKLSASSWMTVDNTDATRALSVVDQTSRGVLALSQDEDGAPINLGAAGYSDLIIGARKGEVIQFGKKNGEEREYAAVNGKWNLGGGGGDLVVNYALKHDGDLVLGNAYTEGKVTLTNTQNEIANIRFGGKVTLDYDSIDALGGATVHLDYTNRIMGNVSTESQTIDLIDEESSGVMLLDKMDGVDNIILTGHEQLYLGVSKNTTYSGGFTLGESGSYNFGGCTATLTLTEALTDQNEIWGTNLYIDAEGYTGGVVELQKALKITGLVSITGHDEYSEVVGGEITLKVNEANSFTTIGGIWLYEGGTLDINGYDQTLYYIDASAGSRIIDSSTEKNGTLTIGYFPFSNMGGVIDVGSLVLDVGVGNHMYLRGENIYRDFDIKSGVVHVASPQALCSTGQTILEKDASMFISNGTATANLELQNSTVTLGDTGMSDSDNKVGHLGGSLTVAAGTTGTVHFAIDGTTLSAVVDTGDKGMLMLTGNIGTVSSTLINADDSEGDGGQVSGGTVVVELKELRLAGSGSTIGGELKLKGQDNNLTLRSQTYGNNMQREINHLHLQDNLNLTITEQSYNTIWNFHNLTGKGNITWKSGTVHWFSSRIVLDGSNSFEGTFTAERTSVDKQGRHYGTFVELAHDEALQNATLIMHGKETTEGKSIMTLAVNTDNAKLLGLDGDVHTAVCAGASIEGESQAATPLKTPPVSVRTATLTITGDGTHDFQGNVFGSNAGNGLTLLMDNADGIQKFSGHEVSILNAVAKSGRLELTSPNLCIADTATIYRGASLHTGDNLSLEKGMTLAVSGDGNSVAWLDSTLKLNGGMLAFDGQTLQKDTAALKINELDANNNSSLSVFFSSTSGLQTGTTYKLAEGDLWSTLTYEAEDLAYLDAVFAKTDGLSVTFRTKEGALIWEGSKDKNTWSSTAFGISDAQETADATVVFNDLATSSIVQVEGNLSARSLIFDNTQTYSLDTANGTLSTGDIILMGSGEVTLGVGVVSEGSVNLGIDSKLIVQGSATLTNTESISGAGTLIMDMQQGEQAELGTQVHDLGGMEILNGTVTATSSLGTQTLKIAETGTLRSLSGSVLENTALQLSGTVEFAIASGQKNLTTSIIAGERASSEDEKDLKGTVIKSGDGKLFVRSDIEATNVIVEGGELRVEVDEQIKTFLSQVDHLEVKKGALAYIGHNACNIDLEYYGTSMTVDGGTLQLAAAQHNTDTIKGDLKVINNGTLSKIDGGLRIQGKAHFGIDANDCVTLYGNWGKDGMIFEGNVSGDGLVRLTHGPNGEESFTFAGNENTFKGTFEVNGKTSLVAAADTALAQASINIKADGGLLIATKNAQIRNLSGDERGFVKLDNGFDSGALTVNQTEARDYAGSIGGGLSLTKTGNASLRLGGDNSEFSGRLTLQEGTLILNAAQFGSSSEGFNMTLSGGTLTLEGGSLNLRSGDLAITETTTLDVESLEHFSYSSYQDGEFDKENGYAAGNLVLISAASISDDAINHLTGSGLLENKTLILQDNNIVVQGAAPSISDYHVNTNVRYGQGENNTAYEQAKSIVLRLADAKLELNSNLNQAVCSGGIVAQSKGATVNIGQDVTLNAASLHDDNTVYLDGKGTYQLEVKTNSQNIDTTLGNANRVELAEGWAGTVQLQGAGGSTSHLMLEKYGHNGSSVMLAGTSGWLGNGAVITADLLLEGENGADALTISNGSSNGKEYFQGAISGSGSINRTWGGGKLTFHFSGDLSQWTGSIKTTNGSLDLYFYGDAKDMGAAITTTAGKTTAIYVGENETHPADVTFQKEITATSLNLLGASSAKLNATTSLDSISGTKGTLSIQAETNVTSTVALAGLKLGEERVLKVGNDQSGLTISAQKGEASINAAIALDAAKNSHSITGADGARIENAIIDLAAGTRLEMANVTLGANSCITDDTAVLVANGLVLDADIRANLKPLTYGDAIAAPAEEPADMVCFTLSNIQDVLIEGKDRGLVVNMVGDSSQKLGGAEWLRLGLGEDDMKGQFSDGLNVTLLYEDATGQQHSAQGVYTLEDVEVQAAAEAAAMNHDYVYFRITANVPEPATGTLSLLALAALAARRRRK